MILFLILILKAILFAIVVILYAIVNIFIFLWLLLGVVLIVAPLFTGLGGIFDAEYWSVKESKRKCEREREKII